MPLRYSYLKTPFPDEQKIICSKLNPLHARYRDLFNEVPQNILRWRIITRTSASELSKAAQRTHLARRWKNAFSDVMRKKGYAHDGGAIINGEKVPGLQGTLEVLIHGGKGMKDPYDVLLKHAELAIAAIVKEQRHASDWKETRRFT